VTGRVFTKLFIAFLLVLLAAAATLGVMGTPTSRILLAVLPGVAVAALLAAWGARQAARSLEPVARFARRLASGDLSARVVDSPAGPGQPAPGESDTAAAADDLNEAAARLQRDFFALELDRSRLTTLLDSMEEAVVAVDSARQVAWCNAAMQRIAASPVQRGRALAYSVRDPDVLSAVEIALAKHEASRGRATAIAPHKIFEVNAAPMPDGGAVAVLHDVSEIERLEIARRDFVANVSHELRTPLTCVAGYVETLLDDPTLSRQAHEFLQIILKHSSRMTRLTEDLLALSAVESGDYKLNLQPESAAALVEDAVASLDLRAMDSAMIVEVAETAPGVVMADADAIHQVFGNLVENARKYGQSGGRVVAGARNRDGFVEFYVQDFGQGIAYEHLPRIFERFYRVDKARSRESGGTGLGLAIAKHIILAHGGDIRCESELGHGAAFLFRLPAIATAAPHAPSPQKSVGGSPETQKR